MVFILININNI